MNKDKIEELIAASKLGELLHKKEEEEEKSSGVEPLMLRGLTERIRQKNL